MLNEAMEIIENLKQKFAEFEKEYSGYTQQIKNLTDKMSANVLFVEDKVRRIPNRKMRDDSLQAAITANLNEAEKLTTSKEIQNLGSVDILAEALYKKGGALVTEAKELFSSLSESQKKLAELCNQVQALCHTDLIQIKNQLTGEKSKFDMMSTKVKTLAKA